MLNRYGKTNQETVNPPMKNPITATNEPGFNKDNPIMA